MRAFATLLWEQWRQTWRGLGLIAGALFAYWFLLVTLEQLVFFIFSNNPRIALAAAFVPVAGGIGLLFMQESRSQIGFAYPRRMFWLPVRTYALVGAQFVFKVTMVALLSLAAGWICATEIKPTFAIMPQVLFFTGLSATLLGLVFLMCGYGNGTGLALFVPAAALSLLAFQPVASATFYNLNLVMPPSAYDLARIGLTPETGQHLYVYPEFSNSLWWGGAATLIWWAIVGYLAARHARSEVPGDRVGRWVRMLSNLAFLDRDNDQFSSPEAAHRWFEWRRVVYLYPWITLALGLLMVATMQSSYDSEENKFIVGFSLLVIAPAIVAVLIGYALTRPDPRYMWFVGGRPLTTTTIARVRLLVSMKAIAIAYVLAIIAYTITNVLMFGSWNPIDALVTDLQLITSTYGTLANPTLMLAGAGWIAVMVVWSLFWLGRSAGVIAWIAGLLAGAYFGLSGSEIFEVKDSLVVSPIWTIFGGSLTILLAISFVAVYGVAIRRELISVRILPLLVAMVALSAGGIYMFREVMGGSIPLASIAIWLLVPVLPLASVPVTLAWQRHR